MIFPFMARVQLGDLVVILFLMSLSFGLLVLNLVWSGSWTDAVKAIRGEYTVFGVPHNPWFEFLPFFVLSLVGLLIFSWLSIVASKSIQFLWLRVTVSVILNLIASLAFAISTTGAFIVHWWFQQGPVIAKGLLPSFWPSMIISFLLLTANCCRFLITR